MRRPQRGYTLVELLVVIGIIALLVGILLPVISRTRRAADAAKCLANLKSIGNNNALYVAQTGRLPLFWVLRGAGDLSVPPGSQGSVIVYAVFHFGGMSTHDQIASWYVSEKDKPLTAVADKSVGPADPYNGVRQLARDRNRRDLFRCPADSGSVGQKGMTNFLTSNVPSPYESFGTSYMANRFFIDDPAMDAPIRTMLNSWTPEGVDYCNKAMSKIMLKWKASHTVLASDVWFLFALWYESTDWKGAHASDCTHNVLFLDGHAEAVSLGPDDVQRIPGSAATGRRLHSNPKFSTNSGLRGIAAGLQMYQNYSVSSPWGAQGGSGFNGDPYTPPRP
jgi:prepilin-type N-terminal cleavage/methylation domain-containing protein/prepilin-type processing-associated H-X9-DG protein